jgi:hypothetical protein
LGKEGRTTDGWNASIPDENHTLMKIKAEESKNKNIIKILLKIIRGDLFPLINGFSSG